MRRIAPPAQPGRSLAAGPSGRLPAGRRRRVRPAGRRGRGRGRPSRRTARPGRRRRRGRRTAPPRSRDCGGNAEGDSGDLSGADRPGPGVSPRRERHAGVGRRLCVGRKVVRARVVLVDRALDQTEAEGLGSEPEGPLRVARDAGDVVDARRGRLVCHESVSATAGSVRADTGVTGDSAVRGGVTYLPTDSQERL